MVRISYIATKEAAKQKSMQMTAYRFGQLGPPDDTLFLMTSDQSMNI